ncbi:MAG: helix-turn-helix transcriptional regulator [Erysipelotrichaceae bacterium]|nr:helix-turn-helix transcriptional regulator [Erysipelotrichaceae bacterium]
MRFSERLKEILGDRSVYQFAEQKGLSHQYIYNILNGQYDDNPSPLISSRMCLILDISPEDLKNYVFQPDDDFISEVCDELYTKILVDQEKTRKNLIHIIKGNDYKDMSLVSSFGFTKSNFPNIHLYRVTNELSQFCLVKIDSKKIYDRSSIWYIDQNIRDYTNLLLLKNANFNNNIIKAFMPESIDVDKIYNFLRVNNRILFVTSSLLVFQELSNYNFNLLSSDDMQIIFVRANYSPQSAIISGKQIIDINKTEKNKSIKIPQNKRYISKPTNKKQ